MSTITTKLPDAIAIAPESCKQFLLDMQQIPQYVISPECKGLFSKTDAVQKSIEAMFEAGVAQLPYPVLALELWGDPDYRYFASMTQTAPTQFEMVLVEWLKFSRYRPGHGEQVLDAPMTFSVTYHATGKSGVPEWNIVWGDSQKYNRKDVVHHAVAGLSLALMMAHLSELDREVIDSHKLNKNRRASGKTIIQPYTIIRIGHVYDESGKKIKLTDATRRTTSIHMRAAHTRRQHHGAEWIEEHPEEAKLAVGDVHIVLIPAVLVNYCDGSELPLPKPRLVRI